MRFNFWCQDPEAAASAVSDKFPEKARECIELADDVCRNSFTFPGHWEMERTNKPVSFKEKIIWDHIPEDDPEWTFAFNRHSFLVTLGKAWRLSGGEQYAETFVRLLSDWIENVPLTDESKSTTWRPIETGLRCENWLRALSLFEGCTLVTDTFLRMVEASLSVHANWLLQAHTTFQKLSNWGVLQDHGLLLLGLAFHNNRWCTEASERLDEQLRHQIMADGTHWEQSPLYHCEVLHCCLDCIQACRRANFQLPEGFMWRTHTMALALAYMLRPDGLLLCQSDSDEVDARDLLALAALLFQDPVLKAYARGQLYEENYWDFADLTAAYQALSVGGTCGSIALPDSGNYMLWDGGGEQAGFLHFHCGSLGSGHGHADLLHIDLVDYGESILVDSGRYTYVDIPLRKQLKRPAGHNTSTVDEKDFSVYQSGWCYNPIAEPVKSEYRFTPHVDYVSGLHLGYLDIGVVSRRRVLRLGKGLWVIWDDFRVSDTDKAHRYDRYFHFNPNGEVVIQKNSVYYESNLCKAEFKFPGEQSISISRAPVSREYNKLEEGDCIRLSAKQAGHAGFAAVIATAGVGTRLDLEADLLPVHLVSTGEPLSSGQAQALRVRLWGEEWVTIVLHTEVISEVSLLEAGGYTGYGKVLAFGPSIPDGICLAW